MIIAGIDAAIEGDTGVVLLDSDDGRFKSKLFHNSRSGYLRHADLRDWLRAYLTKENVKLIVLEDYFFSKNSPLGATLGELHGVMRTLFTEMGIKFILVHPIQLKKYALGATAAKGMTKDRILQATLFKWGVYLKSNDEADAFVLAKIGQAVTGNRKGLDKVQQEVVAQLLNKKR